MYEKLLEQLSGKLNQIHEVNHSSRYWRIVIGHWLFFFISAIYDRYLSVKAAIDSSLVTNTWFPPFKSGSLVCADHQTFLKKFHNESSYNLLVFGEIARKLKGFPFEIKHGSLQLEQLGQEKTFQYQNSLNPNAGFLRETVTELIQFYSKCVSDCSNDIVFANSYLTRVDLIRLQLALGQVPYLSTPKISSDQPSPDFNIRGYFKFSFIDNEFESLLDDMLAELIPTCYVEGYARINKKCQEAFPRFPKAIFTAAPGVDVGLNLWIASQIDKGVKLITTHHGGGYGSHLWSFYETHEIKTSDKYFTWGWTTKGSPSLVPTASGKLFHAKRKITQNPRGFILWINYSLPPYARIHLSDVLGPQMPVYIDEQRRFLSAVSEKVRELILLRLYMHDYGWGECDRWGKFDPPIKMDQGNMPFYEQINNSRLVITTYNSTTYLEAFVANVPTILFWNPRYEQLRVSAQPFFDDLRRVGILHDTPESAAEKVNEVYEDPMSWWSSLEIQEVKTRFCYQFARTSDNWISEWKEKLLKIVSAKKNYRK